MEYGTWDHYRYNDPIQCVTVHIGVVAHGWSLEDDLSNLSLVRVINGVETVMDANYLNEDDNEITDLTVSISGNTSHIDINDAFLTEDLDALFNGDVTVQYMIRVEKNGNMHQAVVTVNFSDEPTSVKEIYIDEDGLYYDLQGHSSVTPFSGINIHNGKKIMY